MSRLLWFLSVLSTRLWLRASIYGVVAVVTALISIYFGRFIPEDISQTIGADAVGGILNILASSMLAVTIFSVSTMVSAYSAATNNATPRATQLLVEDRLSQDSISTFIGTFIYSIVGIVALRAGAYTASGRLVLFLVTIFVIIVIVITLLRWIEYLSRLGRVSETVERVEDVTTQALEMRLRNPYLGGKSLKSPADIPQDGKKVFSATIGYIQHIDMDYLSGIAEEHDGIIYIRAAPGQFVDSSFPLTVVSGIQDEDVLGKIHKAFIMGRQRSFRQDPRYGLSVLSEIGIRALSPGINDPGTAIHVLSVGVRIFSIWAKRGEYADKDEKEKYPRVYVHGLQINDLFEDFFAPISRDAAGYLEVASRLQKAFLALDQTGDEDLKQAARKYAQTSLKRSLLSLNLEEDKLCLVETANGLVKADFYESYK